MWVSGREVYARVERRWIFPELRHAALAVAREVERRAPSLATSKWWKEERHGVFLDYNQNAKDRTVASAWSVRPTPDARVSMPLTWDEVPDVDPAEFTIVTARDHHDQGYQRRDKAFHDLIEDYASGPKSVTLRRNHSGCPNV